MSWLGGLFTGSNPTLNGDIGNAGNIMGFGTGVGEGDIGAASAFDETLLDGNPAQVAKLLAPQIKNISDQANQSIATKSEFGNRTGGTNASNQQTTDTARANVDNMVSELTGQAATNLGNLGTSTLGLGLTANQLQEEEAQQKLQNQQNSLFGGLITGAVSYPLEAATANL